MIKSICRGRGAGSWGFTLIELLIVVAIIAILAAIAVPNFLEAQVRSKVSRVLSDQRTIATAMESYAVDNNRYPPEQALSTTATGPSGDWSTISLTALTTPIAFLTSLEPMLDVFVKQDVRASVGLERGIPFFYANYDQFLANRNGMGFASAPYPQMRGWMILSWGPDAVLAEDVNNDGSPDFGIDMTAAIYERMAPNYSQINWNDAYKATILSFNYDATNGTKSHGNIHRFGGDIPSETLGLLGD